MIDLTGFDPEHVLFVGIDNGKSGAVAFGDGCGTCFYVQKVVRVEVGRNGGASRDSVLFSWAFDLLSRVKSVPHVVVYEQSQPRPRSGAFAAYDAGMNDAVWFCAFQSAEIEPLVVSPATWQAQTFAQRKTKRDTKELSIGLASNLVASREVLLPTKRSRKANHNFADAVCLAAYGYRKWLAQPS